MKFSGLMTIACAAAMTAGCTGDVRDESRTTTGTEQLETGDRVGTTGTAGVSGDAREFVEKAATGSMAEVQLSQLATDRAQSPEVKQFAQMMVADHTKANEELKQAVSPYNMTVPADIDEKHREQMEELRNLRGAEFDREYISAMIDGHQEMQGLLEDRADTGRNDPQSHAQTNPAGTTGTEESANAALNQWALKTKPSVDQHLETARQIQEKLQDSGQSSRRSNN
jgi:putative membrane protein